MTLSFSPSQRKHRLNLVICMQCKYRERLYIIVGVYMYDMYDGANI